MGVSGKHLNLPVSLNYHSGGNKVDELSSNVGLGWSLSAGGVITRSVFGKPDEMASVGYAVNNFDKNNPVHLKNAAEGSWDTEPDVFYFNVAGFTGKFFIDAISSNNIYTIKLVPYQDIQIVREGTGWKLTDPSGVEYIFNAQETTYIETDCGSSESITPSVVTSWYLQHNAIRL